MPPSRGNERALIALCVSWPKKAWQTNRVRPMANTLIATPLTTWSTRKVTVATAWIRAITMPDRMAAMRPTQMLWKVIEPQTSISDVTVMMPSRAILTTPARSEYTPPSAAQAIGEEIWRPFRRK